MPNYWYVNSLIVQGPKEEVARFKEFMKWEKGVFDPNKIIPYPEHFREMDIRAAQALQENPKRFATSGFDSGGREWIAENWGTETFFSPGITLDSDVELRYRFYTFSPPCQLVRRAGKLFAKLVMKLEYLEPNVRLAGNYEVADGVEFRNIERNYCDIDSLVDPEYSKTSAAPEE